MVGGDRGVAGACKLVSRIVLGGGEGEGAEGERERDTREPGKIGQI